MIGADGRGRIAGYEAAAHYPQELPAEEIESIAAKVLARMRAAGYAHLDPEQEFVRGFVQEFRLFPVLRSASL